MKLIKTIQFKNLPQEELEKFRIRKAARAVVFDENQNIGLLYVSKYSYHKLPGGGIEEGEDVIEALSRECVEEIGCNIETHSELGEVIEFREEWGLKQHSYCYTAKIVGEKGQPDFTQGELDDGFEIKWVPLLEAIKLIETDNSDDYESDFIKLRDSQILKEALNLLDLQKNI